jgi:hypothetical protein
VIDESTFAWAPSKSFISSACMAHAFHTSIEEPVIVAEVRERDEFIKWEDFIFYSLNSAKKIFDPILQLRVARKRPKLQYGEEAHSMSLDCIQLQYFVNLQKAQSWTRFKHNQD